MPHATKGAAEKVAWPTVLLICGIVTYVELLQEMGTIDWLGEQVASVGTPLLAALLICFIGGAVSAFASTTGILAALIPLAVPLLARGDRRGRRGHRPLHRILGRGLKPVLDLRRAGRRQRTGRPPRVGLQEAHGVGHEHDHHRAGNGVGDLRAARLALARRPR